MAHLTVYELPDRLFILQASGIRKVTPGHALPLDVSDHNLGELILRLVARELPDAPDVSEAERREQQARILRDSGYRTWLSLDKHAKLCGVEGDAQQLTITPLAGKRFADRKKGFQQLSDHAVRLERPRSYTAASAVREALKLAVGLP